MKRFLISCFCVALLASSPLIQAGPAWMDAEVLAAQDAIQLSDAQKPYFQAAITQYLTDRGMMIRKAYDTSKGNLKREIKRGDKKLVGTLDDQMSKILSPDQFPLYESYLKLLRKKL